MARKFLDKSLDEALKEDFVGDNDLSDKFKKALINLVDKLSKRRQLKDILHLLTKENLLSSQVDDNPTDAQVDGNPPDAQVNDNFSLDPIETEKFLKYLEIKRRVYSAGKIFNDPIHGHMEIHPACVLIIDTPQFQRLRYIKQLGMCYFVYPGASHNRFEHSIGTCYLAGQFCRSLREKQPELGITDMDILCVEIAGLCHDLGHGPFSRLFVDRFGPSLMVSTSDEQGQTEGDFATKQKVPSKQMFEYLLEVNVKVTNKLQNDYGITDVDICFIKEQIEGLPDNISTAWPCKGRPEHKAYLYEIVSNLRNGIDVCKWDYLARDCHHLGMCNNFDHRRYMQFARVINESGKHQICLRDKEVGNVYNMFSTRYNLSKYAYKHHANCAIEEMVIDVLLKANENFMFGKPDDDSMTMSNYFKKDSPGKSTSNKMSALSEMTDDVLYRIRYDTREGLEKSKAELLEESKYILERIYNRKLYSCVFYTPPMALPHGKTVATISKQIIELGNTPHDLRNQLSDEHTMTGATLSKEIKEKEKKEKTTQDLTDRFFVQIVHLDFGLKEKDPLKTLRVYRKDNLHEALEIKQNEISKILSPPNYDEQIVRIYSKSTDKKIMTCLKDVAECTVFNNWLKLPEK